MTARPTLAPLVERFFTERLVRQRNASPHTVASYRDTFRLLFTFAQERLGKAPSALDLRDLDAPLISRFLDHLETDRSASVRTRNLRLTAIRSFFTFASFEEPEHGAHIQRVLAIPSKRHDRREVQFLTRPESRRSSPRPTGRPGSGGATTPCSWSASRPGCASPSWSASTGTPSSWRGVPMFGAWARDARSGARR
jgi:integrase